ncbi:MAG: hypothetical protein EPO26_08630 [Chloroflexota bacterium]|nr:MAG: hypothetical protein EPO26_08630 [Chloroflexota bacterium]
MPTPTTPAGMRLVSVVIVGTPGPAHSGIFLGIEQGMFAARGLATRPRLVESPVDAMSSVRSGRDDFAIVSAEELLRFSIVDRRLVSLMAVDPRGENGYAAVLVGRDADLASQSAFVESFLGATIDGYREARRDPDATAASTARIDSSLDLARLTADLRALVPLWRSTDPPGLQAEARWTSVAARVGSAASASTYFANAPALATMPTPSPAARPTTRIAPPTAAPDRAPAASTTPSSSAIKPAATTAAPPSPTATRAPAVSASPTATPR